MKLTKQDVICCPPPLFHCFGLVMGFLAALTHGSSIVFPSDSFDAGMTLETIVNERCTVLLGVPTMFIAELEVLKSKPYRIDSLRTGLAAGSLVPLSLRKRLETEMGLNGILVAYGMTETSPVTFMMSIEDPPDRLVTGLGKVMPHTSAKVVDRDGRILPRGSKGELCTSGYPLMKGYLENEKDTREAMKKDEDGVVWMHTGDECVFDDSGYCEITGRIKDMIIRGSCSRITSIRIIDLHIGGENIFPGEIEERLLAHPAICEACVVGLQDRKYGEMVSTFLRAVKYTNRPSDKTIRKWVGEKLGRHKIPKQIFWIGDPGVGKDFPTTGSGKHQKHILRQVGETLVALDAQPKSRL
jgi:acyl-CoA synthetase (AMP-forming)/AMP-acid ligase II